MHFRRESPAGFLLTGLASPIDFRGIKIAVGLLILDAGIMMVKKMHRKKLPRTIMVCSCIGMLCINIFAWNFSSIRLMLIAAVVSLTVFVLKGAPEQKGGGKK